MSDSRVHRLKQRVKRKANKTDPRLRKRIARSEGRIAALERDFARIGPQVAALEVRIEDLAAKLEVADATPAERVEATNLLEEVRKEHQRIRARLSAATRFEERLRQVEDAVTD